MEKVLLNFDKVEADRKISILNAAKDQLQSVCDEFTSLNPSFSISIGEVSTLFAEITDSRSEGLRPNPEQIKTLILNRLLPDGKLNGLPVNIEKYEDLFQLPNTDNLLKMMHKVHRLAIEFINAGYYAMDKSGKITIVPGAEEQINESFKIYAENDEEIERLEKAKALVNALNDICSLANNELDSFDDLQRVIELDESGQLIPNPDYIKTGIVGQYQTVRDWINWNKLNNMGSAKPAPAGVPGNSFSNEFLKSMGLDRIQEPKTEPIPVDFAERMKSINL